MAEQQMSQVEEQTEAMSKKKGERKESENTKDKLTDVSKTQTC